MQTAAAYVRVSTEDQVEYSPDSQIKAIQKYAKDHDMILPQEFIFADEGISGRKALNRPAFQRMIGLAKSKPRPFDVILLWKFSRFARNREDSIVYKSMLRRQCGVDVVSVSEQVGEDKTAILIEALLEAMDEYYSINLSEEVKRGLAEKFSRGEAANRPPLGYVTEKGKYVVQPEEAEIVRNIYRWFMEGKTPTGIARTLTEQGIPTPAGKEQWHSSTVKSILTNEKYKGSALLQKRFTVDFLTKKSKVNEGEVPQYYIEESHPAIIVPEEFELVQAELLRRQNLRRQYNGKSVFAARLVCGDCGNFFGAKVWHSNSKYRQVIWQCNHKFQGVCKCQTPHLQESVIQQRFQAAVQELLQKRKAILENCQVMLELLTDCTDLERQLQELEMQKMRVSEQVQGYVRENSEIVQDQEKYEERYQALVGQ